MRLPLAALLLALVACGGEEPAEHGHDHDHDHDDPAAEVEPAPAPAPAPVAEKPAELEIWKLKEGAHEAMLKPELANEQAPGTFKVKFETTKGDFVVQVNRDWAPLGADRFYNLVKIGYFEDIAYFRAINGFMVQFGISGYPEVATAWRNAKLDDDPVTQSNKRGRITFATSGPNTRTTQMFINYRDNGNLDGMGFSPFGEVVSGMEVVDSLYQGYGEGAPRGKGPSQGLLQSKGNAYLKAEFPKLDYINKASLVE